MTPFAAPDAETLRKFALGDLPQDEWDRVARHLEAHPLRPETLAELGTDDTFVSALRAVPPGATDDPPELRSIIASAANLVGADETGEHAAGPGTDSLAIVETARPDGWLGRFRIVRELGRGGMGIVYAARDDRLDREVALKVMAPKLAANPAAKERFLREARGAARVEHDNIVPVLEVGEDRGAPFIAMPLLRGQSLDDRLQAGPMPVAEVLAVARGAAEGLAAAHARGLIHRDIKPSNIWLEANDDGSFRRVRILDFGLARLETDADRVTQSGAVLGTPAFMAPEQARAGEVDARADLFSLGCVLYRMTTGRNPFAGTDTFSILSALAVETPPPPRGLNPAVPRALNDLIVQLLSKAPDDRPQTAGEVLRRLEAIPTADPSPMQKRKRLLPVAAFALSLIALVGALFGGTIVRIATNKGELVVDVNDPNVELVVKQDGAVVVDKTKDRRFVLTAKDGEIEFLDPESGATAQTKAFRLTRGGVDRVVATVGDRGTGPVVEKPKPDERRATVERILAIGGNVVYFVGNRKMVLTRPDQMPAGPFDPVSVGLFKIEKVTAELVAKIAEFEKLEHLHISRSSADARGYERFDRLSALQVLDVAQTGFDDSCLRPIGKLPELRELHLTETRVTASGLKAIESLPSLRKLGLANLQVGDGGISVLAKISSLEILDAGGNGISEAGLMKLASLPALADLTVSNNPKLNRAAVERFAAAVPHCRVRWDGGAIEPTAPTEADRKAAEWVLKAGGRIRVDGERVEIADRKDLPKGPFRLTACNLSYRDKLDETGMAVFASCRYLEELDFLATKVTAAGLGHFRHTSNLEVLVLDFTFIDDDALVPFQNCTKLRVLGLKTTKVTARGLAHLAQNRNLTELSLEGPTIDDAAVAHFQNNHKLRNLFLSHAGISNDGLAGFANCTGLVSLNLDHVGISDSGFRKLNLKSIQEMILSGTGITDAGLAPLDGNTAIHTLYLAGTKVTDSGLAKLKNCSALATLNLGKLPITDDGLAQLNGLKFTALNLGYTKITDDGLAHLKASTGLIQLELPGTAVSDKGVSALREFRNLKVLELSGCTAVTGTTFTDSEWNALESLGVARTGFSDDGLATLAKCPKLRMLHCEGSKATRTGAYKLHDALPKCRIVWDGGTIDPK